MLRLTDNVEYTERQYSQWQSLSSLSVDDSHQSLMLSHVIELEKQWLQCELLYYIAEQCCPLHKTLLESYSDEYAHCPELLTSVDNAIDFIVTIMKPISKH